MSANAFGVGEFIFTDLIKSDDFDLQIKDGEQEYSLKDIVHVIADGLSGRSEQVENSLERVRKNMIRAVVTTLTQHKTYNEINSHYKAMIAGIVTDHAIAKAFILNEQRKLD
jgi:hypothetical protein